MDARRIAVLRVEGLSWAAICEELALSKGTAHIKLAKVWLLTWLFKLRNPTGLSLEFLSTFHALR